MIITITPNVRKSIIRQIGNTPETILASVTEWERGAEALTIDDVRAVIAAHEAAPAPAPAPATPATPATPAAAPAAPVATPRTPAPAKAGPPAISDDDFAQLLRKLDANDRADVIAPDTLDRFVKALTPLLTVDRLHVMNEQLKAKRSGPLTRMDIAVIACIHRDSVINNGKRHDQHCHTSPVKRIETAPVTFGYRATPFDKRQIQYALTTLEAMKFTRRTAEPKPGIAARYWLSDDPFWTDIFE